MSLSPSRGRLCAAGVEGRDCAWAVGPSTPMHPKAGRLRGQLACRRAAMGHRPPRSLLGLRWQPDLAWRVAPRLSAPGRAAAPDAARPARGSRPAAVSGRRIGRRRPHGGGKRDGPGGGGGTGCPGRTPAGWSSPNLPRRICRARGRVSPGAGGRSGDVGAGCGDTFLSQFPPRKKSEWKDLQMCAGLARAFPTPSVAACPGRGSWAAGGDRKPSGWFVQWSKSMQPSANGASAGGSPSTPAE